MFGYVMCNVQSNTPTAVEGFRKLKVVMAAFSVAILLVGPKLQCACTYSTYTCTCAP